LYVVIQFSYSSVSEDYVNPSFLRCRANAVSYFKTKYFKHARQIFSFEEEAAESTQQYYPDLYKQ
jgi:hypothetical protein